jgi:hypothetical protein
MPFHHLLRLPRDLFVTASAHHAGFVVAQDKKSCYWVGEPDALPEPLERFVYAVTDSALRPEVPAFAAPAVDRSPLVANFLLRFCSHGAGLEWVIRDPEAACELARTLAAKAGE